MDAAVAVAVQGDLPWSPSPPAPIAAAKLPAAPGTSSTPDAAPSNSSTAEQDAAQQQQQQESFVHQLLAAPEQEGAVLSAEAWKRASSMQAALLALNLGWVELLGARG